MSDYQRNHAKWTPPHCPNAQCRFHAGDPDGWAYKRAGYYLRQGSQRRIQRFTCLHCGRSFSTQTFSGTYWQRYPDLDRQIFLRTLGCMSNRQIARDLEVAPETVGRRLKRIGRHCLLYHSSLCRNLGPVGAIVVDGFETFEWSQYYPFHHLVGVEKGSDFFIYFNDIELRRKGSMSAYQRIKREQLEAANGRPSPSATGESMTDLLTTIDSLASITRIHTDDHPAYRRPIRECIGQAEHITTSSRARRTRSNPLWEVNLLDLLIRHCSSNHKRETIAWSKRRQSSCERLGILLVWRNYIKRRSEKVSNSPTPAMIRGILQRPLSVEEILRDRYFPDRIDMPARWREYYSGKFLTRALTHNRAHELKYAF